MKGLPIPVGAYLRALRESRPAIDFARFTSGRSLQSDFIVMHIAIGTLLGALAIGGLWWTADWVMKDNSRRWAVQWVERLDSLGTPLYAAVGDEEFERVKEYVWSFPEITFVRYYRPDGSLLFESASEQGEKVTDPVMQPPELDALATLAETERSCRLESGVAGPATYRASTSLWAESILADGLIGVDFTKKTEQKKDLLGFVEIGLNFQPYRATMTRHLMQWSVGILAGLFVLSAMGLVWFRRALEPLRSLQDPLSRLAEGELDVIVEESEHAELAAINEALAISINALHERDRKLREAASFDPLTGLMGREGLMSALADELEVDRTENVPGALLFVDLDQFKYVNDTLGHAAGDRLLVRVANLFRRLTDGDDLISRYGGDEFVLLCRGVDRNGAELVASKVVDAMGEMQFSEADRAFNVRCSIGVAMLGDEADGPEDVLAQADMACHEAKGLGRNRYQVFVKDRGEREQAATDMGWSERIREALKADGLALHYQPIVRIEDDGREIYEVLLRMRDDKAKLIPPGAFLPAATRFGLMGDLDYWVIRTALAELAEIRKVRPNVVFTINLSGIVFSDSRLVQYVSDQLNHVGLEGSAVVFEITEQVAVRHIEEATSTMRELIDMGCRFALDDFGTGFSSFNYLKRLPASFIKLDGTFIENIANDAADRAIVTSIVEIARAVGIYTVAEHARDAETMAILKEIGIDYAQGYYLGRPIESILEDATPVLDA